MFGLLQCTQLDVQREMTQQWSEFVLTFRPDADVFGTDSVVMESILKAAPVLQHRVFH